MPNLYLQMRPNGGGSTSDPGYKVSPRFSVYEPSAGVAYSIGGMTIDAGWDWSTYKNPAFEIITEGAIPIGTADKLAAYSSPWVEFKSGKLLHEFASVAGRTIGAFLNEEIYPASLLGKMFRAVGGRHFGWMQLGRNPGIYGNEATFRATMLLLMQKFREAAGDPVAPIVIATSYAATGDAGAIPYFVTALKNIVSEDENVVVVNTYEALPNYTSGVAAGYYSDGTHYNQAGQAAYGAAYWSLWTAA